MPVKKKQASNNENTDQKDLAKLGRSYYDIVDVFNQKIISSFLEDHESLRKGSISNDEFKALVIKKLSSESEKFKSWGWDVLLKNIRD